VRVTLPDGRRYVMFNRLSTFGMLYKTANEDWQYLVVGVECFVSRRPKDQKQYLLSYHGTLCATENNPLNDRQRSNHQFSSPSNFKSPTTGGDGSSSKGKW